MKTAIFLLAFVCGAIGMAAFLKGPPKVAAQPQPRREMPVGWTLVCNQVGALGILGPNGDIIYPSNSPWSEEEAIEEAHFYCAKPESYLNNSTNFNAYFPHWFSTNVWKNCGESEVSK